MTKSEKEAVNVSKNNVKKWRVKRGLAIYRERYQLLRNHGFTSYEANRLKYKNDETIKNIIDDRSK